jgi:hypothetical protein
MVPFNTGNAQWDQGLGTLGNALFPDPSRIAQAGYYGAEQRKALAETERMGAQQAATNAYLSRMPGSGIPTQPLVFAPSALAGMPPHLVNPSLPMAGQGQGQAPPLPTATLADTITTQGSSATPPPASSPAPNSGAPVAPNTTASNGTVPVNDQGSGPIHPGTFTTSDGGTKMSGPAAADGSPKPFDVGTLMALAVASGATAEQAHALVEGYIADAFNKHLIDRSTMVDLDAQLGQGKFLSSATTLEQQRLANAGQLAVTQTTQAGETARKGMELQNVTDAQGNPITIPLSQAVTTSGLHPYTPALTQEAMQQQGLKERLGMTQVSAVDAKGNPVSITLDEFNKGKGYKPYDASTDKMLNEPIEVYVHDAQGNRTIQTRRAPLRDVYSQNLDPTPAGTDALNGVIRGAIAGGAPVTPPIVQAYTATTPVGAQTPGDQAAELSAQNRVLNDRYAPTPAVGGRKEPVVLGGDINADYQSLAHQYWQYGSPQRPEVKGSYILASQAAFDDMVAQGQLPANINRGSLAPEEIGNWIWNKQVVNVNGQDVIQITRAPGKGPIRPPARPNLSSTVAPKSLGPAPTDPATGKITADNKFVRDNQTGRTLVVRGGQLYETGR